MMTNHSYPPDKCTFELLSAYLDGEVTSEQRQQVKELLAQDPEIQALYRRLLNLRQEISHLPTPTPEYTSHQLSQSVFAKIDRQKKQRRIWLWGTAGTLAAVILTTLGGIVDGNRNPILQVVQETPISPEEESLVIALNEPLITLEEPSESLAIPLNNSLLETIEDKN